MIQDNESTLLTHFSDSEVIRRVTLKMSHLFSLKEKQRQVIGEFLNSKVMSFNSPGQSVNCYDLTYRLGVIGAFTGTVLLNLDSRLAQQIAQVLFASTDPVTEEDQHAAMQELLNIFGGHLATTFNELGIDFDITTPELSGDDFLQMKEGRRVLFRFSSEGRIMQFVLTLKRKTPELQHA